MAKGVKDIDRGMKRLVREFRKMANGKDAFIGVQGQGASEGHGGIDNVSLFTIHEFGVPEVNIPERSVLRSTVDEKKREYAGMMKGLLGRFVDGKMTSAQVLAAVGEKAMADMKTKMVDGIGPPLKEATKKRRLAKGTGTRPLHDTEQLKGSLSVVVK